MTTRIKGYFRNRDTKKSRERRLSVYADCLKDFPEILEDLAAALRTDPTGLNPQKLCLVLREIDRQNNKRGFYNEQPAR